MSDEWTSISVRSATKSELAECRKAGESWDAFFTRWLADGPPETGEAISNEDLNLAVKSLQEDISAVKEAVGLNSASHHR